MKRRSVGQGLIGAKQVRASEGQALCIGRSCIQYRISAPLRRSPDVWPSGGAVDAPGLGVPQNPRRSAVARRSHLRSVAARVARVFGPAGLSRKRTAYAQDYDDSCSPACAVAARAMPRGTRLQRPRHSIAATASSRLTRRRQGPGLHRRTRRIDRHSMLTGSILAYKNAPIDGIDESAITFPGSGAIEGSHQCASAATGRRVSQRDLASH